MNRAYFENNSFYDGQPIALIGGDKIVYLREMTDEGGLIVGATVDPILGSTVVLSRQYLQAGLTGATITLLAGFSAADVAQLATETELNAVDYEGRWNQAGNAVDALATRYEKFPTGNYFGQLNSNDLIAVSALAGLNAALLAKNAEVRNQKRIANRGYGEMVLDFLGL